jgi:hypothetical protein
MFCHGGKYHKIGTEKTALGMELYRERFSFFDLTGD